MKGHDMKKLSDYNDYEGTDVDLETALYEYGLIWKPTKNKDEYHFIYGVDHDGSEYNKFDRADMSLADWVELFNESWVDIKRVESFADTTKEEMIISFPNRVDVMISYYGYENIFGSSYYPFEIKNDEI